MDWRVGYSFVRTQQTFFYMYHYLGDLTRVIAGLGVSEF
jgi:hypothetical protein